MSISPASPPSTRPSLGISPTQKLRFQENKQAIETLEKQISKEIKGSYAFTFGKQERDEKFQKVFVDFFKELRGPEPLVNETAQSMADRFIERPDISYSHHLCEGFNSPIEYCPNPKLVEALESIIEKEYGLQDQFLEALDSNGKQLSALELEDRDTKYRDYYILCRLFPRCVDTLKAIFKDLLIVEWLRQDSGQGRLVLAESEYKESLASLWQVAKQSAEDQKVKDAKLSERHWQDFKTDLYQTASSGALSLATKKPQFVASQVAKLGMNVIGRQVDPHGQSKVLKALNMLSSVAVSKAMSGNTRDLVTSLGVDVVELAQRPENTSKEKALLRGYASALTKGAFSRDTKKLTSQILGFVASTVADILPKAKKSEAYRALRATATNSDIHGHFIDKGVERYFKEPEKPTPKVEEISQVEEPKEQFDGQWLEDVFNEKLSHVAVESAQEIGQNLDKVREQINQIDEVIKVGTQHLNNLEIAGEHLDYIDNAHYEVRQRGDYWRVYRNGKTIYKEPTWKSKAKDTCKQKIPELKKQYGTAIPTQAFTEAKKALDRASIEKSSLLETKESLQQQLPESMLHVEYEKDLAEYNRQVEEYGKQVEHCQAINQAVEGINEKQGIVKYRGSRLEDRLEKLQKEPHKKSVREKADNEVTKYNNANADLDTAINHYNALTGNNERVSTKKMKKPEKPSWDDRLSSRLRAMGVESVNVSTSVPLYPTRTPQSTDRNIPTIQNPTLPPSNYSEMEHQVNLSRSELIQMETTQSQSRGNWGEVQSFRNQQIFQENMAFRSAQQAQGTAQHEISRHNANMSALWGNGVDRNVKSPPVSTGQAIESGIRELIEKPTLMQQVVRGFFNPDRGHLTPNERIEQSSQIFSAHAKPIIKGAGNLIDQLRSFGMLGVKRNEQGQLELAYDRTFYNKFSEWADGNLPTVDSRVELVASVANEFVLQSFLMPFFAVGRAKPLANRVLANPENFGRELRAIQGMQNPVHRSGIGNPWTEMFPMQPKKLAGRSVAKIEPKMIQAGKGINRSNNHQFVTWVEQGQTRTASIGEMSHAGTFHDRGGLTKAGRALDKKASRVGSVFPKPKGNVHEINAQGQKMLDEILNHPDKTIMVRNEATARMGYEVIDIRLPDGRGARFTKNGKEMICLLEPKQ